MGNTALTDRDAEATPERSRRRLGLGVLAKLVALTSGVAVLIVLALTLYFDARQLDSLEVALRERASAYGRLLGRAARSAVAFDDRETAREVLGSVAADRDVLGLGLFTHGESLEVQGKLSMPAQRAGEILHEDRVYAVGDRLIAISRVTSLEGPTGTLVVELSTQSLDQARRETTRASLAFGGAILIAALLLTIAIARSMTRRIRAISSAAAAVAAGELDQRPLVVDSTDELGGLAGSFNAMVERLRQLIQEIQRNAQSEQERLESLVAQRTSELFARNRDLRLVMDNVEQGFFTIDAEGTMSEERSHAVERWFGAIETGTTLWNVVDRVAPGTGARLALGWNQVVDGFLPLDVALDQISKRFETSERYYDVAFRPLLREDGGFDRALVVITDVTHVVERERAEEDERETVNLLGRQLEDRAWVDEFIEDARCLLACVERRDLGEDDFRITIHTLKGNSSLLGLTAVARACHDIESSFADGQPLDRLDVSVLVKAFARVEEKLARFRRALVAGSGQAQNESVREELLRAIQARLSHAELERMVKSYALEPVELRLRRAAEQVRALASRLGKGPVNVKVECDRIRAERSEWQGFWLELPHVLRNAVDHGLERPEVRLAKGKPAEATIVLRAFSCAEGLTVEVEDHGSGIDWCRVESKARELGVLGSGQATPTALSEALFRQGLTTTDTPTEISGRGVGLSAIRDLVVRRGGRVKVESTLGRGTKFSFVWPVRSIHLDCASLPPVRFATANKDLPS